MPGLYNKIQKILERHAFNVSSLGIHYITSRDITLHYIKFYQTQVYSLPCLVSQSVSQPVTNVVDTWLMWPWRVKIRSTSSKVTQPLLALPAVVSFDTAMLLMLEHNKSHVVDAGKKQKPCCWCRKKQNPCCWCRNKTRAMLLMSEQKMLVIRPNSDHCLAL